jgi:hypothetical protein
MGGGTGRRRILITGAALLGLLAAVGLASRAHTPTGGGGGARGLNSDILLEYALVLVAAAAVVVIPVSIYAFVAGQKEENVVLPSRRNWMGALFLTMGGLAVVSIVLLSSGYFKHHHGSAHRSPLNPLIGLAGSGKAAPRNIRFDWMPVIVVGSLTVAVLTAIAFAFVRSRETARPRRAVEALVLALEQTLEDLRAEPDPRRAVIAAYSQMEHALGRAGLAREPSEAPREYLYRVLPGVGAGAASVERLTALFERAKFSPHAIDGAMKEEAIAALESLRDELRGRP